MLRLPEFRLLQPRTLAEAATMLAGEGPGARLVAGGTDLWPNLKRRHQKAESVISLAGIAALREVEVNGEVRIRSQPGHGAEVTVTAPIAVAPATVASGQVASVPAPAISSAPATT